MEYGNYYKSKYTILHVSTKLEQKKGKKQKNEMDADPPQGDGERARKSLLKKIFYFIIICYNINKLKYQKPLGPYMG